MKKEQDRILEAARRLAIRVTDLSAELGAPAALLERDGRAELFVDGVPTSLCARQHGLLCGDKQRTKQVFERVGIPSPPSVPVRDLDAPDEAEALRAFFRPGQAHALKPVIGTHGEAVELEVRTLDQVRAYWARWRGSLLGHGMLVERQVQGHDLRLQALDGRILAACIREPAHVIGDGERSVATLVEARRRVMVMQNPENELILDAASLALLEDQGLELGSVPEAGRKVRLKKVSNIFQGGHPIDVTDRIHPAYAGWIEGLARFLRAPFFALDAMVEDPAADPREGGAWALEINHEPNWLHHTFSEGRTHEVVPELLRFLFAIEDP